MKHNWEYKKLGDICEILDSQRKPVTKTERVSGPYPYYGASGIQDYVHDYLFDGKYLLVGEDGAKWGSNEKSAFSVSGKIWVNNHAHVLDFASSPVKQNLIEYFLCFKDLNLYVKGAIIPKLNQQLLKAINVPIPPREVQERIVAELDKINEVIEECREFLRTLDSLAQSIFYDTFGDPISNPKGWEKVTLNEVCNKITDGTHNSPKNEPKGDYMYVTAKNIKKSGIVLDDITYIDKDTHRMIYNRCNPEFGDVLYIKDGVTTGIATINQLHEEFSLLSSVALLKPSERINNQYLKSVLNTPSLYNSFRKNMGGAAITRLTISKIQKSSIPVPPLSLQQQFAAQIEAIEAQKNAVEATISELKTLLDSRMDYWFNE